MEKLYFSWSQSRYLTWEEYKKTRAIPPYIRKECKTDAELQARIESIMNKRILKHRKKILFA